MPAGAFALASAASAALWAGAAMAAGALFARQIGVALDWMTSHVPLAMVAIAALVVVYGLLKAWQRYRMTRLLAASMMSIDELRDRLAGEARPFVIDVGSSLAHDARPRIPGAVLLDLDTIAQADDFPDDRDIVLYCACPNEASARRGAQLLMQRGYRRVRPLAGGIEAWARAGYPVEHGAKVTFVQAAAPVACRAA